MGAILFLHLVLENTCTPQDVKEVCCPMVCATKASRCWPKANDNLRLCMQGLGCSKPQVRSANAFNRCGC